MGPYLHPNIVKNANFRGLRRIWEFLPILRDVIILPPSQPRFLARLPRWQLGYYSLVFPAFSHVVRRRVSRYLGVGWTIFWVFVFFSHFTRHSFHRIRKNIVFDESYKTIFPPHQTKTFSQFHAQRNWLLTHALHIFNQEPRCGERKWELFVFSAPPPPPSGFAVHSVVRLPLEVAPSYNNSYNISWWLCAFAIRWASLH